MRYCSYPECSHGLLVKSRCKLHKLPSDEQKCQAWMVRCRLAGTPRQLPGNVHICSCHFVGNQGPTRENPLPTLFVSPTRANVHYDLKVLRPNVPDVLLGEERRLPHEPDIILVTDEETIFAHDDIPVTQGSPESQDNSSSQENPSSHGTEVTPQQSAKNVLLDSFLHTMRAACHSFESASSSVGGYASSTSEMARPSPEVECNSQAKAKNVDGCLFSIKRKQDNTNGLLQTDQPMEMMDQGAQCDMPFMSYEKCVKLWSNEDFGFFTGISKEAFVVLYEFLGGNAMCCLLKYKLNANTPVRSVESTQSPKSRLFMTLVRLRRGYPLKDMSLFFSLPESSISSIFLTWIKLMSQKFKSLEERMFVSVAVQQRNSPECFKPFPNLRCIVDTTEIKIQKPSNMEQQSNTYSVYKESNTVRFLIASSVYGGVSFVSDGVEGSMTDRQLFLKSGIMEFLKPGEAVIADRGFDIEADLNKIDVDLLIPPFLGDREAFTERELLLHKAISTTRIHVETLIGRIKEFSILCQAIPATMHDIVNDIVRVCAVLVNFGKPVVRWHEGDQGNRDGT